MCCTTYRYKFSQPLNQTIKNEFQIIQKKYNILERSLYILILIKNHTIYISSGKAKIKTMKINFFLKIIALFSLLIFADSAKSSYWLVIGTYRQGPGGRPEVSGITSPSLHSIPMKDLESCKKAGNKITKEIYNPVWQFDSRWTCVFAGNSK